MIAKMAARKVGPTELAKVVGGTKTGIIAITSGVAKSSTLVPAISEYLDLEVKPAPAKTPDLERERWFAVGNALRRFNPSLYAQLLEFGEIWLRTEKQAREAAQKIVEGIQQGDQFSPFK
jgi:hypothetical protein